MRFASESMAGGAYNAMIEAVTMITDEAWDANKSSASTLYYLEKVLMEDPVAYIGPVDEWSTKWEEGTYWDENQMTVTFDSEQANYTYQYAGPVQNYRYPYSESRVGIKFTKQQMIYLQQAKYRRYDLVFTEFNAKMKELMTWQNRQLLNAPGVPALGGGAFQAAYQTWDIYGLRNILNNNNNYYSAARPATGELSSINLATVNVPANALFATISGWQSQVRQNYEPTPWVLIAPETTRQSFVAESVNVYAGGPGGAGARAVQMNEPNKGPGFAFDTIDFREWGVNLYVIFENLMPGTGASGTNNEFLLLNPSYIDWKWIPGNYYDVDEFDKGGMANPGLYYTNMYLWWTLHTKVPKAHARITDVTLPAV